MGASARGPCFFLITALCFTLDVLMTLEDLKTGFRTWKLTRERVVNLAVGFAAVLIYEFVARPYYRPYMYRNNINDFHLADTIGNSLGTIATVYVLIGFIGEGRAQHLYLIKIISFSVAMYEIAHPLLGKPIDGWDIAATIITGFFCYWLYKKLHPKPLEEIVKD
jgi:hypothetical protein